MATWRPIPREAPTTRATGFELTILDGGCFTCKKSETEIVRYVVRLETR